MFTGKKVKGSGDINTVMLFAPLIQLATTELAGRFVKRMTFLSVFIAVLALFVSLGAYQATKPRISSSCRMLIRTESRVWRMCRKSSARFWKELTENRERN